MVAQDLRHLILIIKYLICMRIADWNEDQIKRFKRKFKEIQRSCFRGKVIQNQNQKVNLNCEENKYKRMAAMLAIL